MAASISMVLELADAPAGSARAVSTAKSTAILTRDIVPLSGVSLSWADGVSCRARAERAALRWRQSTDSPRADFPEEGISASGSPVRQFPLAIRRPGE